MLLFSTVLNINKRLTKESLIKLVIEWNQSSPHTGNVITGIQWHGEKNIRYGNDDLWLDIEEYRNRNIIAARYEKKEADGSVWDTDYVMNFETKKMAVRLDRSYTEDALEADPKFSTPHFITLLIERGYLEDDNGLPVQREATIIDEDNIELAADVINGVSHYRLPVVYISKTRENTDPVNVPFLCSKLKGVAHVLLEGEADLNTELRQRCNDNNEYYGAVGIYFPTKASPYRRYLYRSVDGYDDNLFAKIVRTVTQYCNAQMVDTLLTWQGVNNAVLRDRLAAQRQERLDAEAAQKRAETEVTKLLDSLDDEEKRIRTQAYSEARAEADKLLESFDSDMKRLQKQIEELTHANEVLQMENQGLRTRVDSMKDSPLLKMGDEPDFYNGEAKDLVLTVLVETLKTTLPGSRRADIIQDVIENNNFEKLSISKAEKLKTLLKNYDGMSSRTRQELKDLGFEITEDGKHYKLTYYGDGRYTVVLSKTPSDWKTGKNSAAKAINIAF